MKKDAIDFVLDRHEEQLRKLIKNTDVEYEERYSTQFKEAQATYNYLMPGIEENGLMISQLYYEDWRRADLLKLRHKRQYDIIIKLEIQAEELNKIHEFDKNKLKS